MSDWPKSELREDIFPGRKIIGQNLGPVLRQSVSIFGKKGDSQSCYGHFPKTTRITNYQQKCNEDIFVTFILEFIQ